ncbi:hypothetical protein [Streptomyces sp. Ru87]|uniref:hypothetical protein n=1 Tax=Streptomyces sp. Ru87 TaxID=2044307 RepID=UPI000BF6DCCB|nr:hypothetical protein [Streptomyces sp. Ru87]PGH47183.1 hypothetical protein CRI70_30005 [Streptomyces sp. Ru87]
MSDPTTQLALSAASALVAHMATEAWEASRNAFVRLFQRREGDAGAVLVAQLERGASQVERAQDRELARTRLVGSWQLELTDLLAEHPELADELRQLLAEIDPSEETRAWHQTNVAREQGTVYAAQGGNVIHHSAGQVPPAPPGPGPGTDQDGLPEGGRP